MPMPVAEADACPARTSATPAVSRLTVAICTWNRAELLRGTLDEMTRLVVPDDVTWELLVVNNNCTDATDDVIATYARRLPIRRIFQPAPGLSNARNAAVGEATGEYVVWTDDDVLVPSTWLLEYHRAFTRWSDASVFGGPVDPWFTSPPPAWLQQVWPRVANAFAVIDLSATTMPLTLKQVPFGANMAVRTDQLRAHPYDPALGLRPGSRMGGEETAVIRAILGKGGTGWWLPAARVRHYVGPERQTLSYLRSWYEGYGAFLATHVDKPDAAHLLGRPRWLWRRAAITSLRYGMRRALRPPDGWIDDFIIAHTTRGHLAAYVRPATSAGPAALGAPDASLAPECGDRVRSWQ
jgi:glycosyltransferase involved in cell wall biosynthesis